MTTWLFVLHRRNRDRDRGSLAGLAVVAPEASYLGARRIGLERIERAFATPVEWREIVTQLEHGHSSKMLAAILLGGRAADYLLQHLKVQDLHFEDRASADTVLDALLTTELAALIVRGGG